MIIFIIDESDSYFLDKSIHCLVYKKCQEEKEINVCISHVSVQNPPNIQFYIIKTGKKKSPYLRLRTELPFKNAELLFLALHSNRGGLWKPQAKKIS